MNQAVIKMVDDWGIPDENVSFDDFGDNQANNYTAVTLVIAVFYTVVQAVRFCMSLKVMLKELPIPLNTQDQSVTYEIVYSVGESMDVEIILEGKFRITEINKSIGQIQYLLLRWE